MKVVALPNDLHQPKFKDKIGSLYFMRQLFL